MKKIKSFVWVITFAVLLSSCSDIIETNLNKKAISVLAPGNGIISPSGNVTFWWSEVKGASAYELQIVKPDFEHVQYLILDSNVASDKFTVQLQPGQYSWRIRAVNSSSETPFVTSTFSVDSTTGLGNQGVALLLPANNSYSNKNNQVFKWSKIYFADDYRFELLNESGNLLYLDAARASDTASYTFLSDGIYTWRVRAQNISSVSPFSQSTVMIDATPPGSPTNLFPANGIFTKAPFTLTWASDNTSGSPVTDSIFIYSNSGLTDVIRKAAITTSSYTDSLAQGTYYWDVRSYDKAGNSSNYSNTLQLNIN